MERFDLFHFYRFLLATVVCIYCTTHTAVFLWRWSGFGEAGSGTMTLLRRYVIVLLLRARFRRFFYELLTLGGLAATLCLLLLLH